MFNDKYGLTQAVLEGRKTMTRHALTDDDLWNPVMGIDDKGFVYFSFDCSDGKRRDFYPQYQIGEVVAVEQSYEQVYLTYPKNERHNYSLKIAAYYKTGDLNSIPGWTNKMFVRAHFMPHRIRIKDIKVERLQDISDEDCRKEGIIHVKWRQFHKQDLYDFSPQKYTDHDVWTLEKFRECLENPWAKSEPNVYMAETPQIAFAVLIDRISGKGTWKRNPWVFVYNFELIR